MSAEFELVGSDKLIQMLVKGQGVASALARALYEEGQDIFAKSQQQVPHDTGVLMASGMLHQPAIVGDDITVEITYGGAASAYAEVQHENESYRHDPGRKAKYLEDPLNDALPSFDDNLAIRVEAIMRGLY